MSKVAFFSPYFPKFFFRKPPNFLGTPKFFTPQKFFGLPKFFYPLRPGNSFFRLFRPKKSFLARKKPLFLDLKNFFRLFRPKIFFKSTQFLTKTSFKPSKL